MDDKKKMHLGRIMEDKKNISMTRIMEDLVKKQKNDSISKELWMMKTKRWVWNELWKIKK